MVESRGNCDWCGAKNQVLFEHLREKVTEMACSKCHRTQMEDMKADGEYMASLAQEELERLSTIENIVR